MLIWQIRLSPGPINRHEIDLSSKPVLRRVIHFTFPLLVFLRTGFRVVACVIDFPLCLCYRRFFVRFVPVPSLGFFFLYLTKAFTAYNVSMQTWLDEHDVRGSFSRGRICDISASVILKSARGSTKYSADLRYSACSIIFDDTSSPLCCAGYAIKCCASTVSCRS